jgi:hypothetical protein
LDEVQDTEDLHAINFRLLEEVEQLRLKLKSLPSEGAWVEAARMLREADQARRKAEKALRFYADKKRYQGANQPSPGDDPYTPLGFPYLIDTHRDNGAIARAALGQS